MIAIPEIAVPEIAIPEIAIPEIAVVIPSHERPLRLRWLLNALEQQTLAHERFEVIVCHDSRGSATAALLRSHPLAARGVLHHVELPAGHGPPGRQRNRAWRAARAPLIAFTDDDCRPPPEWLERALAAAHRNPGAVVQGMTRPDPDELSILHHAPHARSQQIDPPTVWAQMCNMLYPRELLERVGGLNETMEAGEDTELGLRTIAAGASYVAAPEMLMYHCVHASGLTGVLRSLPRWQHIAGLAKRYPSVRESFTARIFWRDTHGLILLALLGGGFAARGYRVAAVLALPWAAAATPSYGSGWRGRVRALSELPARALVDLVELGWLVRGSVRYRTVLL